MKSIKKIVKPVHLEAVVLIVVYFIVSNFIFVGSVIHSNIYLSFLIPLTFGTLSTFAFIYLFGHKDFFNFIHELEEEQKDNQKKYLDKFKHLGRILACILIAAFGGPIILALAIRFLFSKFENRYLVAFISNLISTIVMVGFARGLFNFFI